MPSDCRADAAAWYGPWDSPQHAGLPGKCLGSVSAWKPRASKKFPIILQSRARCKKACPNTADRVRTRNLLGGQAASRAVPWLCERQRLLCPPPGRLYRQDLWGRHRHRHRVILPPSPRLPRASPRSAGRSLAWGLCSCLRESGSAAANADLWGRVYIKKKSFVPEGTNPTLFFHFPAALLFFSSCPSLSVSLPQRGQPFTPQFPAMRCAL